MAKNSTPGTRTVETIVIAGFKIRIVNGSNAGFDSIKKKFPEATHTRVLELIGFNTAGKQVKLTMWPGYNEKRDQVSIGQELGELVMLAKNQANYVKFMKLVGLEADAEVAEQREAARANREPMVAEMFDSTRGLATALVNACQQDQDSISDELQAELEELTTLLQGLQVKADLEVKPSDDIRYNNYKKTSASMYTFGPAKPAKPETFAGEPVTVWFERAQTGAGYGERLKGTKENQALMMADVDPEPAPKAAAGKPATAAAGSKKPAATSKPAL